MSDPAGGECGSYGNASGYRPDPMRKDHQLQATERLRDLITAGLESGEPRAATDQVIAKLRRQAFDGDSPPSPS